MRKLILFLLFMHVGYGSLPEPYNSIRVRPFDPDGWYYNAVQMEKIIRENNVKIVVEVGCWLGKSTRHIASLLPEGGKVYAVDHWLGSPIQQEGQRFWNPILPYIYQQFLSNVIHENLTHKIIPIRMSSVMAAEALNIIPDMVYIDADHEKDSVYADLKAWYPLVKGRGILCGDDWVWVSVSEAVKQFAYENRLTIETQGDFWRLHER